MAITKYRKREKSTDSESEGNKIRKPEPNRTNNKVLDSKRSTELDSGNINPPLQESTIKEGKIKHEIQETKVLDCVETSKIADSDEELIDTIRIEDEKNFFEIRLSKKANRLTKISLHLNGLEIKPHTYGGMNAGSSYFNLLKKLPKYR